ncbi:MAG: ABC transporter ATP-binding protein [Oscillospiraceae bacterium]|nr:ABC transporter ATP-binding protein [Oscillospiraceae bacterium]
MKNKIDISGLIVEYGERGGKNLALDGVTFSVPEGQFVSVVGSSGCGKSTLLYVLGGLCGFTGGTVLIDGKPVTGPGSDRGFVFQQYSLFPWMTARKNVMFGVAQVRRGYPRREIRAVADEYLNKVGLTNAAHRYPSRLSGGMQQRVAIARTLAMGADVLLMDEPFGAVDAKNRVLLQELLLDLWSDETKRKTVVFVTHDLDEAIFLSDRIIMLTDSPGSVYLDIAVEFPRPRYRDEMMKSIVYDDFRRTLFADFFGQKEKKIERDSFII